MKKVLLTCLSVWLAYFAMGQIRITGQVTDESQSPMPGVTILLKGTTISTITDPDGKYTIEATKAEDILVFSFMGYNAEEIMVGNRSVVDVNLLPSLEELSEVIVVGYGSQKKVNVTGSVVAVDGDKLKETPVPNATQALAGRLPGVTVQLGSAEPGYDDATIRIRGASSNPLVIVDGVEMDFSRLDPNDIESFSVLKDASAAIYGARAGNGVILVTTKKGKKSEKANVELSTSYGWQGSTVYPDYVDAAGYMELVNDYQPNTYSEDTINAYKTGRAQSTDWYDATFRKSAPIKRTNVNITGGTEKIKYFMSYGNLNQESILRSNDTKYKQNNIRSNITTSLTDRLDVSMDISYRDEHREYPGASLSSIMEKVGFSVPMYAATYPDASKPSYNGAGIAPNYVSKASVTGYDKSNYRNLSASFTADYKVPYVDGLSAKVFYNYTTSDTKSKSLRKDHSYYTYDKVSGIYNEVVVADKSAISLSESFDRAALRTAQFSLNYKKSFNDHNLNVMVLYENIDGESANFSAKKLGGFISTAIDQLDMSTTTDQTITGSADEDGRASYLGRINYDYAGKYLLEAMFRYDGSGRFDKDDRWGFFPAVTLGWRLSEEDFIKDLGFIDNFKLRGSVGKMGYDRMYDENGNEVKFNYLTGYRIVKTYAFNGQTQKGIISKGLADENASWEKMTMYNFGYNLSLWNRLVYSEFDVFYRYRDGILGQRNQSLPSTFGATLPFVNLNSQKTKGFELMIGHENKFGDLRYWVEGNLSFARAKWDHYDEPVYADEDNRNRYQKSGKNVNRYLGIEALGIFTSQEEIDNWNVDQNGNLNDGINTDLKPGDIKYADYNGDGVINELDNHEIGKSSIPELFYGINVGAEYKGIDFSMLWQGASNYNVMFTDEAQRPFLNGATPLDMFTDRWTEENNNANARFPRTCGPSGNSNNYKTSTFWLQDGSYIRLKNVTLGYSFNPTLLQKVKIDKVRVYFSGINLVTFTDVYPYDPETPDKARGWDYPQQRTYMFGAVLNF